MKTIFLSLVFILFAIFFTGCNDDFGTQPKDSPIVNAGSVQVKISTTASPFLKDGDDNEPEPMFCITGFVTENGNPVKAEVELVALPKSTRIDSTNTDNNGGFEFYQVPSGSYNVVVVVSGGVAKTIEVNL